MGGIKRIKITPFILMGILVATLFSFASQPSPVHSQTWDQWKHYLEEDESIGNILGPPEYRLIRERYVHSVEESLDPIIEEFLNELDPKFHEEFLEGQILVQVKPNGKTALVYFVGDYKNKRHFKIFLQRVKKHRYPKFPKKMDDGMIQFSHTIDEAKRRKRLYYRYEKGILNVYN